MKLRALLALALILCMSGTLAGCGGGDPSSVDPSTSTTSGGNGFDVVIDGQTVPPATDADGNVIATAPPSPAGTSGDSGSSGKTGATGEKPGATTPIVKPDDPLPSAPPTPEFPGRVLDLKGRKITVLIWDQDQTGGTGSKASNALKELNNKIQKELNCTLAWVYEAGPDFMASIAAGKPKADIWGIGNITDFQTAYTSGYIQPLDPLGVIDFKDRSRYTNVTELSVYGNKHYGVGPRTFGDKQMAWAQVMVANFDLIKGYTREEIYRLQNNNQMTWEKFGEICKSIQTTGGVQPIEDCAVGVNKASFYQTLVNSNNTDWIMRSGDSAKFTGGEGAALAALNQYESWSKSGIIKQLSKHDDLLKNFTDGKTAFLSTYMTTAVNNAQIKAMNNYGVIYPPIGPNMKERKAFTGMASFAAIPKNVQKPNEVATVLMQLCTPVLTDTDNKTMANGVAANGSKHMESVNTIMEVFNKTAANGGPFTLWYGIGAGAKIDATSKQDGWYDLVRKIGNQNLTAAGAVQSAQQSYNEKLKRVFTVR